MQISPKTLQELWKKEEEKTIELEQTMRRLLKEKRVRNIDYPANKIYIFLYGKLVYRNIENSCWQTWAYDL